MKRLLRISLDTLLNSLISILIWIILGIVVDSNISHIFTITYSIQFISTLLVDIFGTGSNVTKEKENKDCVDNNIVLGSLIMFVIILFLIINVDGFLKFMYVDPSLYRYYCIYSFGLMFFQLVLRLICEKLYFKNENVKANKINIVFNIVNLILIVGLSILYENKLYAIVITLIVDLIIVLYYLINNIKKLSFSFNIKRNMKYVSNEIFDSFGMFIVYLIGQRTTFEFGNMFLIAMNFESLITDTQWDMSWSIITGATIDASKDKLKYEESLKNGKYLSYMLIATIILMAFVLYPFYKPTIWVLLVFVGVQIIDLILSPKLWIRQQYMQINYSARKNTFHKNVYEIIRIIFSFVPTPFCTCIGQFSALLYEVFIYDIYYNKKYYIDEKGYLKMLKVDDLL